MFSDIIAKHKKEYLRKGLVSDAHLRRLFPNKYKDYSSPCLLNKTGLSGEGKDIAVLATIREVSTKKSSSGVPMLVVKACDREGTPFTARFIGMTKLKSLFRAYIGSEIFMAGLFQYDYRYGYSVFNPTFSQDIKKSVRYTPVYGTIKNIPESAHVKHISEALSEQEIDTIPRELLGKYPDINRAFRMVHYPADGNSAALGQSRVILDDIIYFKLRLMIEQAGTLSQFRIRERSYMDEQIGRFPYVLTGDQKAAIEGILRQAENGRRIRALVQGDVGSGKTAVAFCLMFCASENGFLSVLMAPTQVLAKQHYEELCKYVPEGNAVLLDGTLKGSARTALEKEIDSGSVKYVIGTSALITSKFDHSKIGLAIIDEEHRFGVGQRTGLYTDQTHIVTMSATPIPRTLAQSIYGSQTAVYQIREKPAGRLPVKTYYDDGRRAQGFLYARLKEGGQAYVICAAKEDNGAGQFENVKSADEIFQEYKRLFEPLGFRVGMVTGSTHTSEKTEQLRLFSTGVTRILVATTVVEVGVNVPDATAIIILNAERFGLATMHQLRGRVGRGCRQAYCVLVSQTCNERIRTMCMTNDGFAIAEEDLKERKSGDLLGIKQTGKSKFVEEIINYPEIAEDAEGIVRKLDFQSGINHLEKYNHIFNSTET